MLHLSDNRLALQVLHGLTSDNKTFRSLVQHMTPIPSFDTLRSMLKLEERTNHKHSSTALDSAIVATPKDNSDHFTSRGTPHHRGGHCQPRRGGRNNRSSHHGFNSNFGQPL